MDNEIINQVINEIITNTVNKCKPLKQVRSELSKMPQAEKTTRLKELLNPAELEHYDNLLHKQTNLQELIREHENLNKDEYPHGMVESLLKQFRRSLEINEDARFQYERRIIQGNKKKDNNEAPTVDMGKYATEMENYVSYGEIEQEMIDKQSQVTFTSDNINSLTSYFSDGFALLNSRLNNGKQWNNLSKSEKDYKNKKLNAFEKNLSDAISKTDGLVNPTRLYHFGKFDVSLTEGDHIQFKGYTSTSFQKHVATDWGETYRGQDVNYTYELLCDKGTKGVCANDSKIELTHMEYEHEYLLDKGTEGTILNVDVENHIVTVLVE